jgi:hypothetical protein
VGEQAARYRGGWLTLVGRTATDREPIEDALIEVDVRVAELAVWRSGRDRARAGAGVEADQEEPCDVPQRSLVGLDLLALEPTSVLGLGLAVAPARPEQPRSLAAGQPSIAWRAE